MNDNIGAMLKWALQHGCTETVVHDEQGVIRPGQPGQCLHVGDFAQRVRWRFDEQHPGFRAHRSLPLRHIRQAHKGGVHTELRQVLLKKHIGGAKHAPRANHVITRFQQRPAGRQDGRHAGRRRYSTLSAFHRRNTGFKRLYRGIGKTGIDIARLLTTKPGRCLCGTAINEARRWENCVAMLQLAGANLTGTDRESVHRHALKIRLGDQNMFFAAIGHDKLLFMAMLGQSSSLYRSIMPLSEESPAPAWDMFSSLRAASSLLR